MTSKAPKNRSHSRVLGLLLCVSGSLGSVHCASAQWTVTDLSHSGTIFGNVYSVNGQGQAGSVTDSKQRAGRWTGTAASWVDLSPPNSSNTVVYALDGSTKAGAVDQMAAFWDGSDTYTNLHPAGATGASVASAARGGRQGGSAQFSSGTHAGLWSGTASSWQDLHPSGATSSWIYGMDSNSQVGAVDQHAAMWNGTSSWTDLHPSGFSQSTALGADSGQQVGYVQTASNVVSAALWAGNSSSFVNLAPNGSVFSKAEDVFGGLQVGYAAFTSDRHAGLWAGSAGSWQDLHQFLPANFTESWAYAIWSDASTIYIGGTGRYSVAGGSSGSAPILWTKPVPEPGTLAVACLVPTLLMRRRKAARA